MAVATGAPDQARRLHKKGFPFPCLLDPDRNLYRTFEIRRIRLWEWSTWRVWRRYLKIFWERYIRRKTKRAGQGRLTGNISQLPGLLVLDEGGRLQFLHKGNALGDYPPFEEFMKNLRALSVTKS